MKANFWGRWSRSILGAGRNRSTACVRSRLLCLAPLEDRVTPTLTPQMVFDINATTLSANPSGLVTVGSIAYFIADDGVRGTELWKSDGPADGTAIVKDIN